MMELSDFYPPPSQLIHSELRVLDLLRNDPYITAEHPTLAGDATKYYSRFKNACSGFAFFSHFDICHAAMVRKKGASPWQKRTPNVRLVVAAQIGLTKKGSYSNVSYCFAVGRIRAKHPSILRKFHFDVTISDDRSQRRLQQHPQCHLQYCGEMIPDMAKVGFRQTQLDQMHPWLSEPRIFYWPMSLALLVDMALHEFPDPRSLKFRASNEWRSIIRTHEALVLQRFHEECIQVITGAKGNNRTLADQFYVD
jgi:hypothetical protein